MRVLSLLLVARSITAPTSDYTTAGSALRAHLLRDYDPVVPPRSTRTGSYAQYSGAGTDVELQVRFFKLDAVHASDGHIRLKVWFRMQWYDERLQWDAASWNVTEVFRKADAD